MIYLCIYLYVTGFTSTALMYKALDETHHYQIRKSFWVIVTLIWPIAYPYALIKVAFDKH
jgi:hypothetical protein